MVGISESSNYRSYRCYRVQCRREWGGGSGGLSPPNNFLTSGVFSKKDSYIIITKVL